MEPALSAVQAVLELLEALAAGDPPAVEPDAQQRDSVPEVIDLGFDLLHFAGGGHAENSDTE